MNLQKEKNVKQRNVPQDNNFDDESTDEENIQELLSDSDDYDLNDELTEKAEDNDFMDIISNDVSALKVNDWIIAKFSSKRKVFMYVAQVIEITPCIEVKFARRVGKSSTFHWPNVEDTSTLNTDEVFKQLPVPIFDKRGRFKFSVSFDSYKCLNM